ncbi:group II intron reverse transcriptase/maturase [Micromonospora sp. NPDC051296]|uniref:group II intron reverse transcriptase/maturase n=1 Tax=Micromonospora sp. NPDC051296 TaxID=3155046 RepID=UPI003421A268
MNTDAPWPTLEEAEVRVLEIQTKLHQWAMIGPDRQFKDLYNLVYDPAVLLVAWHRVRGNRGARSAGVDGVQPRKIAPGWGLFLFRLHLELKDRTFQPVPVRERMIPKANGKLRGLGIPTARDRTVQAALKLILEPVFEADFKPCSYGFRPRRRAMDAITEIHQMVSRSYEWVFEGDIKACFDEIDHPALMDRIRRRIGDKRVLALVKAFLKAGVLTEAGVRRNTNTGAPQGGILSPLLANIALSVLDEHFSKAWAYFSRYNGSRLYRRRRGLPTYKLIRYADDFVVVLTGTREHAEALREEVADVLATMGLRLSEEKTTVVHIDEGFEFLGFRIQRQTKQGTVNRRYVYVWPSKKALATAKAKVRTITSQGTNKPLADLLRQLNPVLRGWSNYFRHGNSKATFSYLHQFTWRRIIGWLRRKHRRANWKQLRRRYLPRWWPTDGADTLFDTRKVPVTRYYYRGTKIPAPWRQPMTIRTT